MKRRQTLNPGTWFVIITMLTVTGTSSALAPSLEEYSRKINAGLPETYDPVTKLLRTSVAADSLVFHFLLDANKEDFASAFPKVKAQVLRTVCQSAREGRVLRDWKKAVVYRYENIRGQELGEFQVRSGHCGK